MSAALALKDPATFCSPATRSAVARRARAALCRRSLYEFVQQSFSVLEPGTDPEWSWHIAAFCFHVQAMLEGWLVAHGKGTEAMRRRVLEHWASHGLTWVQGELLVQNMILNLPPGTLKSRILMVCAPAWMWLHCPTWSVCAISSVKDNVSRDSDACRELVLSDWYRDTFEITWTIKEGKKNKSGARGAKKNSVTHWETTAGGVRKSRTMLGGFTGIHVDAIFLDDPDDAHKVHSAAKRAEVQHKWTRSIKNRLNHLDRSIRIAIQQRVHVDDWTACQVNKGLWSPDDRKAWAWVVIPLQFGHAPKEAPVFSPFGWCDPRKVANDNMQPSRFSEAAIADEIRDKGPDGFEAQYNQNPVAYDDGIIKRAYVRFFRVEDEPITTRPRPYGCGLYPDSDPERAGDATPAYVLKKNIHGQLDLEWMTVSIDASNGSEALTASAVGILVVGGRGQERFIFDDRTAVMGIEDMYAAVRDTVNAWPMVGKVIVELKAAGSSVIARLDRMIREGDIVDADGHPRVVVVEAVSPLPGDSKESRAIAMQPSWAQGLVYVLDGAPWLYARVAAGGRIVDEGFINEITSFPRSKRSDRIDAMSQLMTYYREGGDAHARWKRLSTLGRSAR